MLFAFRRPSVGFLIPANELGKSRYDERMVDIIMREEIVEVNFYLVFQIDTAHNFVHPFGVELVMYFR